VKRKRKKRGYVVTDWHMRGAWSRERCTCDLCALLRRLFAEALEDLAERDRQVRREEHQAFDSDLGTAKAKVVRAALEAEGGNRAATARRLGIGERTLYRYLTKLEQGESLGKRPNGKGSA
jgi:DNA-binding NtrC family response regulator